MRDRQPPVILTGSMRSTLSIRDRDRQPASTRTGDDWFGRLAVLAGTTVAIVLATALVMAFGVFDVKSRADPPLSLSVSIDVNHPGARVPRNFLGLSFEMSSLRQIVSYAERGNLVRMLRSLGPGLLRFGGVSADTEVAWTDARTPLPSWSSKALDVGEFRALRKLAARSGWHVLLTIGLAHYDPRAAAREAAAAKHALGRWLTGVELGNEPDAYARHGLRSEPWTFSRYDLQVAAYRRAIHRVSPGLAIVGPDVSGSLIFESWGRGAALHDRPALLTGHHYPLGCHTVPAPSVERLLSLSIRGAEDASLHRYMAVSRRGALRFRLDEANSVSCGGKAGISDRFASALWAVDYIAHAMVAGLAGINLQGNPANCQGYTPVCAPTRETLARGELTARPEWYALLLGKTLVGDRPLHAIVLPGNANIDVLAFMGEEKLRVLIVDDEPSASRHALVELHVGSRFGDATALRLTAPSPSAATGVRLGGGAVQSLGTRRAPAQRSLEPKRAGVIALEVAPASATLVTATP
jgi:hypothetical protein